MPPAKGDHIQEVPPATPGALTYQEVASLADTEVKAVLERLRAEHPGKGGAVLAGAAGAIMRYQLQGMPPGATPGQAMRVIAQPAIIAGVQIVAARTRPGGS